MRAASALLARCQRQRNSDDARCAGEHREVIPPPRQKAAARHAYRARFRCDDDVMVRFLRDVMAAPGVDRRGHRDRCAGHRGCERVCAAPSAPAGSTPSFYRIVSRL